MRVRTIEQLYADVKRLDPDTALTKTALRRLVVSGKLPSVRAGSKYLLNLDTLQEYLQNPGKFEKGNSRSNNNKN